MVDGVGEIEAFQLVFSSLRNDVAIEDSRFFGRRTREYLLYRHSEFALVDDGSNAFEISGKRFVEFLGFVDVEIGAVTVPEGFYHPLDHPGFEIVAGNGVESVVIVLEDSVRFFESRQVADGSGFSRNLRLENGIAGLSEHVSVDRGFRVRCRKDADAIRDDRERREKPLGF